MRAALWLAGTGRAPGAGAGLQLGEQLELEFLDELGQLALRSGIPLMAIHIVTRDLDRLGRRYKIRELLLRAVASGGGWPRMELFANLLRHPSQGTQSPVQPGFRNRQEWQS